jgi:hypothetical protein
MRKYTQETMEKRDDRPETQRNQLIAEEKIDVMQREQSRAGDRDNERQQKNGERERGDPRGLWSAQSDGSET